MAAVTIPAPGATNFRGEQIGPCTDSNCGERFCDSVRAQAATTCGLCPEPIGYDRPYYRDDKHGAVHQLCLLEKLDTDRKAVG